ncbi:hypothetical protein [Kocuria salsicia]|uniref:Major facilitator superfamily (MFS) profile domain-containing protein n=1 Tax=Kocuria salsicia TaxID=664639 RepID=A0ABV3KCM6_9MICC|nr:hypothetical protein [Kocuria salsicia]
MQQYGSCFRAQSHGGVFRSITSMVVAKVMDYGLSIARFCVGFVMLAGAGNGSTPAGRAKPARASSPVSQSVSH